MEINNKQELKLPRRIILVENEPTLRKLLGQNLEFYTGSEIIYKGNADEVTDFLKHDKDVGLIISENQAGDEYTILKIFYYVNSKKLKIPIILLGENPKVANEVTMIDRDKWQKVIKEAGGILGVTAEKMVEMEVPIYYPISIQSLLELEKVPVKLFTFKDGDYSVAFAPGATIDKGFLQELFLSGITHLYIDGLRRLEFAESFSMQVSAILKKGDLSTEGRVAVTATAFEAASTLLQEVGMSAQAIMASKATINSMVKIAESTPSLDALLAILQNKNESYLFRHSLMIAMVAPRVISNLEWGNEDQKNKICFAAFFHDITINDDRLCKIHTKEDLDNSDLSDEEKEKVVNHAIQCSELLKKYPQVPFGAEEIILKHHGVPSGKGFAPEGNLDNRISQLAIVFRVIEDYVHELLSLKLESVTKIATIGIMKKLKMRHNKGQYRKAFEALEKMHS